MLGFNLLTRSCLLVIEMAGDILESATILDTGSFFSFYSGVFLFCFNGIHVIY